jgi:hypothetical protein
MNQLTNADKAAIRTLIANSFGVPESDITDESMLFDDVGAAGLDCILFLEEFGSRYKVDLSTFDYCRYCAEGFECMTLSQALKAVLLLPFLLIKRLLLPSPIQPLAHAFPVSHLFSVVEKGAWFEPGV